MLFFLLVRGYVKIKFIPTYPPTDGNRRGGIQDGRIVISTVQVKKNSFKSLYIFAKSFVYGRLATCLSVLFCLLSNLWRFILVNACNFATE